MLDGNLELPFCKEIPTNLNKQMDTLKSDVLLTEH